MGLERSSDDGSFELPPRACFKLEPRGIGTWQRQRLTDYIVKMATDVGLSQYSVLHEFHNIFGLQRDYSVEYKSLRTINGTGVIAERFVRAAEVLTGCAGLEQLTLLSLRHILGTAPASLLTDRRRWCPRCLQEDVESGREPYERLIWSLAPVELCPLHGCAIVHTCERCGASRLHELSKNSASGFCGKCAGWLGVRADSLDRPRDQSAATTRSLWFAREFANLLALTTTEAQHLTRQNIRSMLRIGIDLLASGNSAAFSRMIGLREGVVHTWEKRDIFPGIFGLMHLAWVTGISMRSWLEGDVNKWHQVEQVNLLPASIWFNRARRKDVTALRERLELCRGGKLEFESVDDVWIFVGASPATLKKYFPDLFSEVRDEFFSVQRRAEIARLASRDLEIRKAIVNLLVEHENDGIKPSELRIRNRLKEFGFYDVWKISQIYRDIIRGCSGDCSRLRA